MHDEEASIKVDRLRAWVRHCSRRQVCNAVRIVLRCVDRAR